ncbi:MAG: hypothetical protein HY028_10590 [Gammaproteobacteria bacterium]|nr:hypothetical protein [Gammaproteobacteria bacterium]
MPSLYAIRVPAQARATHKDDLAHIPADLTGVWIRYTPNLYWKQTY